MCAETNPNFKVKVQDAVLKVKRVHIISNNAYLGITNVLKEDRAKYPVRPVDRISAGSMPRSVDHVFLDVIPQRVVIMMHLMVHSEHFQFPKLQDDLMWTLKK